jgi:mRNA interferase RelE/StbE
MFEIKWDKKAKEELEKLDNFLAQRIIKKIGEIAENPFPHVKKLKGVPYFRLRVGDYRVILDIDNSIKILLVLKLGHRKNIYED